MWSKAWDSMAVRPGFQIIQREAQHFLILVLPRLHIMFKNNLIPFLARLLRRNSEHWFLTALSKLAALTNQACHFYPASHTVQWFVCGPGSSKTEDEGKSRANELREQ